MKPTHRLRFLLIQASAASLAAMEAGASTLTFDTGQSSNNDLPLTFASRLSTAIPGASIANGATPNIALTWAPSPNVLEVHGDPAFDTVDPGNAGSNVDVLQLDLNGGEADPTITFDVDDDYSLRLNSLVIGHATNMVETPHAWTITISEDGGPQVFSYTTGTLGPGDTELVTFNFIGQKGTNYVLKFDDGGADHVRAAIDTLSFNQVTTTKSIAHRGGAVYAPENTLAAFGLVSNKCDMVEIDVRVSSDGHLVLMHDATVTRTTDGTGNVNALTLAQLKALDAGSWFSSNFTGEKIPTFEEAIQSILPYATPMIEHKAGAAASYVAAIQALGVASNVVVISFDWTFLAGVHALDPSIPLAALGSDSRNGDLNSTIVTNILATGADTVMWDKADVSTSDINLVRSLGAKIFVYTADGADIQTWVDLGVDGIVSDDPGLVRYLMDDQPSPNEAFAEGLVSYWKLDDGLTEINSTNAIDVEARNPGVLRGFDSPPTWTTGAQARVGGALDLDGVDDFVDIPQSASLDIGTNAVTISCWVKMDAKPSVIPESFGSVYASREDSYILYQDKANSELRFKVTTTSGNAARPGIHESNLSTGQWHHVVGLYNGNVGPVSGQASIYLDGKLKDVHTGNDSTVGLGLTQWIKAGQHAAIGQDGSDNQYRFSGSVDEVAIWRRTLSHGELLQLVQSGTSHVPLQKQVMSILITNVVAQSTSLYFDIQTQHASLTTNDLALLRADRVSGPYSNAVNTSVLDLGGGLFRWAWPEDDVDQAFFKVVNP